MKKKRAKQLKKSQLRNLVKCEKCGELFPSVKLSNVEELLPPDYEQEVIVKVCFDCDESWKDE